MEELIPLTIMLSRDEYAMLAELVEQSRWDDLSVRSCVEIHTRNLASGVVSVLDR